MGLTTDPNDPGLRKSRPDGQQETYLVLSEEERAKGFMRPVRTAYTHVKCGCKTTMGLALSETYARDPKFYGGTFCCACGKHFPLKELGPIQEPDGNRVAEWQFFWVPEGDPVGSTVEEAAAFFWKQNEEMGRRDIGEFI
jgi:hypothetical protein